MYQINKIVISIFIAFMCIITGMLIIEYAFIKRQAEEMMQLKKEYNDYVGILKDIVQKDNGYEDASVSFDKGEVEEYDFSNDERDNNDALQDSFVVINRAPQYLKQSTQAYLEAHNLHYIAKQLDTDMWLDYTEQVLNKKHVLIRKKPKQSSRIRLQKQRRLPRMSTAMIKGDMAFSWPIEQSQFWISSFFGSRKKPDGSWGFHYGIDMAAIKGIPVKAVAAGIIIEARYASGYGNTIVIAHNKKYKTRYAHLETICVTPWQRVERGSLIGKVGDTGLVRKSGKDASHLHFEIHAFNERINPLRMLA